MWDKKERKKRGRKEEREERKKEGVREEREEKRNDILKNIFY